MSELDAIRTAFDQRAQDYDESVMHREVADVVAAFADLAEVNTVLDVATGTGLVLRAVHARAADVELIGIDLSPGMLAVAAAALPQAELIVGDAALVPVEDDSIDLVTCATALHVIPETSATLTEWRRVLRTDGRAITATFAATRGAVSSDAVPGEAGRPYARRHRPFRDLEGITGIAEAHGFTVTRHMEWTDGADTLLIAEWAIAADAPERAS